jgi:hypothetical protein
VIANGLLHGTRAALVDIAAAQARGRDRRRRLAGADPGAVNPHAGWFSSPKGRGELMAPKFI